MAKPLSAAEVPPRFLEAAFLAGRVPLRALASDPRVSYALYMPARHYANPPPPGGGPARKLPLLVHVHGSRRDVSAVHGDLAAFAERAPCAVLAPLFPAGLDGPDDLDSYMLARRPPPAGTGRPPPPPPPPPPLRADLALLAVLDEVAARWPGVETARVHVAGFSGGGQFAHRFLYLHAARVASASVGAPGRVTLLDGAAAWPAGVADAEALFGSEVRRDLIARVPLQLVVGSRDVEAHGGEAFWAWVRETRARRAHEAGVPEVEGEGEAWDGPAMRRGRLEILRGLQASWKAQGVEAQFDVIEGVAHEAEGVRECVLRFLLPHIQEQFLRGYSVGQS